MQNKSEEEQREWEETECKERESEREREREGWREEETHLQLEYEIQFDKINANFFSVFCCFQNFPEIGEYEKTFNQRENHNRKKTSRDSLLPDFPTFCDFFSFGLNP